MTVGKRQIVYAVTVAVLLLIAAIWNYQRFTASRLNAVRVAEDTARSLRLAQAIEKQDVRTASDGDDEMPAKQINQFIRLAAEEGGFDANTMIKTIRPEASRRVNSRRNTQRLTRMDLEGVTLEQLVKFLQRLTREVSGLQVSSMQLSIPNDPSDETIWNATDVVLSYLVKTPQPGNRPPQQKR